MSRVQVQKCSHCDKYLKRWQRMTSSSLPWQECGCLTNCCGHCIKSQQMKSEQLHSEVDHPHEQTTRGEAMSSQDRVTSDMTFIPREGGFYPILDANNPFSFNNAVQPSSQDLQTNTSAGKTSPGKVISWTPACARSPFPIRG